MALSSSFITLCGGGGVNTDKVSISGPHPPPELCPPLGDVDSEENVTDHCCEDYQSKPAIKRYDKVDNSHANVDKGGGNVEENVTEEIVNTLSTTIHDTKHFTWREGEGWRGGEGEGKGEGGRRREGEGGGGGRGRREGEREGGV